MLFVSDSKGRSVTGINSFGPSPVVDMGRRETITNEWIASKCGWSPFDGVSVQGWPVMTWVRGRRVMADGEILGEASGDAARFWEGA